MPPTHPPAPLEPSSEEFRRWVALATDRIVRYLDGLDDAPAVDLDPDQGATRARAMRTNMPRTGTSLEPLLDELFDVRVKSGFGTAGPGYLAYIPGGGLPLSAVSELITNAVNRYVGVFAAAPLLASLESDVIRWFAELAGLPQTSGGILTSGGSLANLSAIVAARADKLPEDFLDGILYTSDQAHHSVMKSARVAGFPSRNVRVIPADDAQRIDLGALQRKIAEDRAAGHAPFLIVANAGTTNTGAVDPLPELAGIAAANGLWLHVDAAYGGPFLLTRRGRDALRGIDRADSITLDPHKGLFLPYGTGCLLVRDVEKLRRAHTGTGDYMPSMQEAPDLTDFCELSPELSRDFRGLRVWLPFMVSGADTFEAALDEKLDLTMKCEARLRSMPGIVIETRATLSIVSFRVAPSDPSGDSDDGDARTRLLLEKVNARQQVFLTPTTLRGRFVIRICVLSFRTHDAHIERALEAIEAEAAELRR